MVAVGGGGVIVNLSSSSVRGTPVGVHYSATKNGIVGITRSMALALAPHGIRVNAIAPGTTDTAQPRYGNTEDELQAFGRSLPLGRLGKPPEIADLAVYLASDKAEWVTGQVAHQRRRLHAVGRPPLRSECRHPEIEEGPGENTFSRPFFLDV